MGLAGQRLTEMAELAEAGCIAFGQASASIVDTSTVPTTLAGEAAGSAACISQLASTALAPSTATDSSGFILEGRGLFLFPESGISLSGQLGYTFGF